MYYRAKQAELSAEIADIEKYLNSVNKNLLEDLCKQSMVVLKDKLARKYEGNSSRKTFSEDNLWKEPYDVLAEYPVILSTTFSSRNSLNSDVVYDYLIMDEASQVDIATGALALSCARNVVIVGDILHSRVAHSNYHVMQRLGMNVYTSGPLEYKQEGYNYVDFDDVIEDMDIVMLLRVQHERHVGDENFSKEKYHQIYGLSLERYQRLKETAIIMHPAPINRDVEIKDELVESEKSRIFTQMQNGVFVRMAMLHKVLENE